MHNNNLRPGILVYWEGKPALIKELRGLTEAIVTMVDDYRTEIVPIVGLSTYLQSPERAPHHHLTVAEEVWGKAKDRLELIRSLLEKPNRTAADVEIVARTANKSPSTIYRWLSRFEQSGLVTSLARAPRSDRGESRLDAEVEAVVQRVIKNSYLTDQRKSVLQVYRDIQLACHDDDLIAPNRNTIYERIRAIDERVKMSSRVGPKAAKQKYEPLRGEFPGRDFPLAIVQIDHSPVDLIIVDEEDRLPIGKPHLTICLDTYTKMVHGFCLSLERPSTLTAGLALGHAVGRKDAWLAKRDITASWPIYGKPRKIHTDNGADFVGKAFARACDENNIVQDFRPLGQPNYGPDIERSFRTFMGQIHNLSGTTFSNVAAKLKYDSEGRASMTLAELELWFTVFVVYVYHQRPHAGISKVAPINLYNQAVHGTDTMPGIGLPAPIKDEVKFRWDFTPFYTRTIQVSGVVIDHISYQDIVLHKWIAYVDPKTGTSKKFHFARDPRDISVIYFLDPDTNQYLPIRYADRTRPAISVWELRAVVQGLEADGLKDVNETMIFEGYRRMHRIEQESLEKTRLAKQARSSEKRKRTMRARRKGWQDVHKPTATPPDQNFTEDDDDDVIQPFVSEVR